MTSTIPVASVRTMTFLNPSHYVSDTTGCTFMPAWSGNHATAPLPRLDAACLTLNKKCRTTSLNTTSCLKSTACFKPYLPLLSRHAIDTIFDIDHRVYTTSFRHGIRFGRIVALASKSQHPFHDIVLLALLKLASTRTTPENHHGTSVEPTTTSFRREKKSALLTLVASPTWRDVDTIQVPGGIDSRGPRDRVLPLREKQAGAGVAGVDDEASYGRERNEVFTVEGL